MKKFFGRYRYFALCVLSMGLVLFCQILYAQAEDEVDEVIEQIEIKSEQKSIEASEQKSHRPDEWLGPTKIEYLGFIIDVDSIDDANQNFETNVYIALKWHDKRLINLGGASRQVNLNDIWAPPIIIVNQQGRLNTALPKVATVEPNGTVMYKQRFTGKLSQALNLKDFPIDKHTFSIQVAAPGYSRDELKFVPGYARNISGGGIADKLSLPDWKVSNFHIESKPYEPIPEISVSGFVLSFDAERHFGYYIWQIILPLSVIIVMSWAAFWVGRDQIGVRIGIATSSVLTMIAHRFVIASLLPKLPYMTRLDYFTVGGTFLVLFALIMVVASSLFTKEHQVQTAKRIDFWSRIMFPAIYFILLLIFLMVH